MSSFDVALRSTGSVKEQRGALKALLTSVAGGQLKALAAHKPTTPITNVTSKYALACIVGVATTIIQSLFFLVDDFILLPHAVSTAKVQNKKGTNVAEGQEGGLIGLATLSQQF